MMIHVADDAPIPVARHRILGRQQQGRLSYDLERSYGEKV